MKSLIMLGLYLLMTQSCSHMPYQQKPQHPMWNNTKYLLQDKMENNHKYSNFPMLYNNERITLYCQLHFSWEIITAKYNVTTGLYDYNVVVHNKQF